MSRLPIQLENRGLASWQAGGETPVHLAYHWFSADGTKVIEYEGLRTKLPRPVRPGESLQLTVAVRAPFKPGSYLLAWDLVQENRFWFSRETAPSASSSVQVKGQAVSAVELLPREPPLARFLLSRPKLWAIAARMWARNPWLGVGPDNFRLLYGEFAGLEIYDLTYHTHNMFIEFFVNTGLIGGGFSCGFWAGCFGYLASSGVNPGIFAARL